MQPPWITIMSLYLCGKSYSYEEGNITIQLLIPFLVNIKDLTKLINTDVEL